MAVYKEEKTNTWRVIYRYTDWNGERKQRVQPRQRRRLHRQGDHRHGGEGRREARQVRDGGKKSWRSGAARRVLGKGEDRPRLEAEV